MSLNYKLVFLSLSTIEIPNLTFLMSLNYKIVFLSLSTIEIPNLTLFDSLHSVFSFMQVHQMFQVERHWNKSGNRLLSTSII